MARKLLFLAVAVLALGSVALALRMPISRPDRTEDERKQSFVDRYARQRGLLPRRVFRPQMQVGWAGAAKRNIPVDLENYDEELWVANITLGTPPQGPFSVVMDTGSADVWVVSSKCTSEACKDKPKFDDTKSSTFVKWGKALLIVYGTGYVSGTYNNDTLWFDGKTPIKGDSFGEATVIAKFFEDVPMSGIVGLGFQSISMGQVPTVFDMMISQHLIEKNLFCFYLGTRENSEDAFVDFGAIDDTYFSGSLTYVPLTQETYWTISMQSVLVGNTVVHTCDKGSCMTVVDTGTSVIAGPTKDIQPMINAIGPVYSNCSNMNKLPTIGFNINGARYDVVPSVYVIKETFDNGTFACQLGIEGMATVPLTPKMWILGDPFLRQYFSVYDRTTNPPRVGFAPAKGVPRP